MTLPAEYAWLVTYTADGHPKMVVEALKLFGIHEGPADADNPTILAWAQELGLAGVYRHDSTPWCGLFMALVATRAGYGRPAAPLWALNWSTWQNAVGVSNAEFGDVLVFVRPGGGHVGIYIGEDSSCFHVLGGNEGDQVEIARIPKFRAKYAQRPLYTLKPRQVKQIRLAPAGGISSNES